MAFNTTTRNRLAKLVSDARALLTTEFIEQSQRLFGIEGSGKLTEVQQLGHLDEAQRATAILLRERVHYLARTHPEEKDAARSAVAQLVRDQAFTVLNRLAALRMAEKRDLVPESVGKGYQSKGFKVFETVARTGLGDTYSRYRQYLLCLFDELALDLGILFDRRSPHGMLFPREPILLKCLDLLNAVDLDALWAEDETIGWVYQYYNDPAERKTMREGSSAPRNSRELAVRNQFFTPRYVVEFLIDNTLGRLWYESTRGSTRLKDRCRYLIRRPNEVFLMPDETATAPLRQDNLPGAELQGQPDFIPYRPVKDPRATLMLDPACGSMHFGLYAFDLFETIYEEAWELEETGGADALSRAAGMKSLHETYAAKDALLKDVPRLIVQHNLHGIDIDPRCVQIAGLSLWLRAQKAWRRLGVTPAERPIISRSNIVCAEPMPGDKKLLREFVEREFPAQERSVFISLLDGIFDRMQLAGEAGSLLNIEDEIRSAIAAAKQLWKEEPQLTQSKLFAELETTKQGALPFDLSGITDEQFWDTTENRIYGALRAYAEQAEDGGAFQRRLFAEDAAQGFAFVDVCRKHYDVAIMNPPFGDAPLGARDYLEGAYPESKSDIGMAFVAAFTAKLEPRGRLGAITNRVFIANETLNTWRDVYLLGDSSRLDSLLDLGYGVLDDAKVETAAFVTHRCSATDSSGATFLRVLDARDKELTTKALLVGSNLPRGGALFVRHLEGFAALPAHVLAYQLPLSLVRRITNGLTLSALGGKAAVGLQPSDDFRFVRLAWEISPEQIGRDRGWSYYAKGGEYQPYWDDIHLVVKWAANGAEIRSFAFPNGKPRAYARNAQFYFHEGITYPERTTSDLSPRVLPKGCVFSGTGQGVFCGNRGRDLAYIAGSYARAFKLIVDAVYGSGDASSPSSMATHYRSAVLARIPPPIWANSAMIEDTALRLVRGGMAAFSSDETSRYFASAIRDSKTIRDQVDAEIRSEMARVSAILSDHATVDALVFDELAFDSSDRNAVDMLVGPHPVAYSRQLGTEELQQVVELWEMSESELIRVATAKHGSRRQLTMKSYVVNRRCELIAHLLEADGRSVARVVAEQLLREPDIEVDVASRVLSWLVGVALGRWDVRYATGEERTPELPDPFAQLPRCPPGMLRSAEDLPARSEDVPQSYPLKNIAWNGILVDDPNHPQDIERRVRDVIDTIWKDRAEAVEREICDTLSVKSLRAYFRKPAGFFGQHLRRYSKSRRQAPIYWPLSSPAGGYTLWIYYHRLTDQTLHTALADYVDPKIRDIERRLADARSASTPKLIEELADLLSELHELRAELERAIRLPWKPNLNDGVLITASPLWKLFRLPKWQKDLKSCWQEMQAGDHDWAHLALAMWPDRVKAACRKDRSIAIAHGLEHCLEEPGVARKPKRGGRAGQDGGAR